MRRSIIGLSQEELADKLGISWQQLQKNETGQNRTSVGRLKDIATILNVEVTWFFKDDVTPIDEPSEGNLDTVRVKRSSASADERTCHDRPASASEIGKLIAAFMALPNSRARSAAVDCVIKLARNSGNTPTK
jgi:transcriptional regulator with XRE-family HTH domain